ncbi:hypothetical protein [Desulforhopalus singaporensis]|uniref:Uncharacterized protein n=1 Tax=Desulforhopalus singaporensis TaxID=91360 RepID=A0A1H0NZ15_9BACT|nr:hypothetical protein [Desulforhopalus singaporensis]SDO97778.1 hypothetical protein SAMN05660330_01503 [Desulforhopalus singaporensis]
MKTLNPSKDTGWNLDNIRFLHPPDDFTGTFANEKMQQRHEEMQQVKIMEILARLTNENDPAAAMRILNPLEHVKFVINNLEQFKQAGLLEPTVLELYYRGNTPFVTSGDYDTWKMLLLRCDRELLARQGGTPPVAKLTGYRGSVTGIARGHSWTVDKNEVQWILNRWADKSLGGGTVFAIEVTVQDILVYLENEDRKEFILDPEKMAGLTPVEITRI